MSAPLTRWQRGAWLLGGAGALGVALGAWLSPPQVAGAWLAATLFWLGVAGGSLALVLALRLLGVASPLRAILAAGAASLPLMALLLIPLALVLPTLYPWARAAEPVPFLRPPVVLGRSLLYLASWSLLAWGLARWRGPGLARAGLLWYGLSAPFAAMDWGMTLAAGWYLSTYGLLVLAGQVASALALATLLWLGVAGPTAAGARRRVAGWLALSVLALLYLAFAQFLVVWSADLPREAAWYLARVGGGWGLLLGLLGIGGVGVVMALLVARQRGPSRRGLALLAALIVGGVALHQLWLVTPTFYPARFPLPWLEGAAWVAVGGLWGGVVAARLKEGMEDE